MNEKLHKAISSGDVHLVQTLLKDKLDINAKHGMRGTPLCAAISANHPQIVEVLLNHGSDVNAKDFDGEPPLCMSIRKKQEEITNLLLQTGQCEVNKVDPLSGHAPLHLAVADGNVNLIRGLLHRTCDVNQRLKDARFDLQDTPLLMAIRRENKQIVELLLEAGADFKRDNVGYTPLHVAASMNNPRLVEMLLGHMQKTFVGEGMASLLRDAQNIYQNTVLHLSVVSQNFYLLLVFCNAFREHGLSVDSFNADRCTPFFLSCYKDQEEMALLLLEHGANVNVNCSVKKSFHVSQSMWDTAALHCAVSNGNLRLLRALVMRGASLNVQDAIGETPLLCALRRNKPDIVEYILDVGKTFQLDATKGTFKNNGLLHAVCNCDRPQHFIKRLVTEYGCKVNASTHDESPLVYAVELDLPEVVEALLDFGADVNTVYEQGMAANCLQMCLSNEDSSMSVARLLILYGANLDAYNTNNPLDSPLGIALQRGCRDQVELLIQSGCNLGIVDQLPESEFDEECRSLLKSVAALSKIPHRLKILCERTIRSYFCQNKLSVKGFCELPLPRELIDSLMLKESALTKLALLDMSSDSSDTTDSAIEDLTDD